MSHMRYSPPLDGMRAIAVLAVLIFHMVPSALSGGFVGVDVFFVLSGYLITSNILKDSAKGEFSMREFYLRRIQRLLPNIFVTVTVVLLLWWILMPPGTARQTALQGLWAIFDGANFYIWLYLGGYWGSRAEASPLTHTWSLGVEEQFYLIFPALLVIVLKFQPRRLRVWVVSGLIISFALNAYRVGAHPEGTFYLLPTRFWELLIGALLASILGPSIGGLRSYSAIKISHRYNDLLGLTGLGLILTGYI